jgi:hypothetical protein
MLKRRLKGAVSKHEDCDADMRLLEAALVLRDAPFGRSSG